MRSRVNVMLGSVWSRSRIGALATLVATTAYAGCSAQETNGDSGTGGSAAGSGAVSGTGAVSGAATGGSPTGGSPATGGSPTGGSPATGGSPTGGVGTGGTATGGSPTGGVGTGGSTATGGGSAGGSPNGGGGGASGSPNGGASGSGGGTGGSGGSAGGKASGIPVPPGPSDVPKPSGTPGNITVLDWAGFEAAVSWTYDDSLSSQIQHYAELHATGVRQTFYIVSSNNAMNAVWSTAARDGHEIANHSAHHCQDDGTGCSWGTYAGSLAAELTQCTMHITQNFGVSGVYTMAAPFGDAGYATAAQSQFFINRGVAGGQIAPNDNTNAFSLPCKVVNMGETASGFNAAIDMARSMGRWQIMLVHSLGGDGGYNPVMTSDVVSSINRTKGFGDVWQDSVVNIGAYWRAQKVLSMVTPTTSGMDRTWTWTLPQHFPPGKYLRVRVDGGTLKQGGNALAWDGHGYYEIALDAGSVTLSP